MIRKTLILGTVIAALVGGTPAGAMTMSKSQMMAMHKCQGMSHDMMMKNKKCAGMMKMHKGMMHHGMMHKGKM